MATELTLAQQKLIKHRQNALRKGIGPVEYAQSLGVSFQRIGRLVKPGAKLPTLQEACSIGKATKIGPFAWLKQQ